MLADGRGRALALALAMSSRPELSRLRPGHLAGGVVALVALLGSCVYARAASQPVQTVTDDARLSATWTDPADGSTAPTGTDAPPPDPTTTGPTTTASRPLPLIPAVGPPPVPTPMTCLGRQPASAADYREAFANRSVWSGGDIGATVDLGDGRLLWVFGDTFVDGLGPNGIPGAMVRNSLVVQRGGCFSLVTHGVPGARRATLPAAAPGEWLWPSGAVVDPVGLIHVTALRMVSAPGAPGWDWRVNGVDIVTLRWTDLALVSTRHAGVRQGDGIRWGGGTFRVGDVVHIYGWQQNHQVVARVPLAGFASAAWELLSPAGWTTDSSKAVQPPIEQAPAGQFWVVPHGGGYLASSKRADMDSDDVSTWWAPSPVGPFRAVGRAAVTEGLGSPWITYSGRVTHLPGAGLVTVWSRNYRTHDPKMDARRYGTLFAAPLAGSIP